MARRKPASDSLLSELLTSKQVAELLPMNRTIVEDYARRGLLPSLKLGRRQRFIRSDVEAVPTALRDASRRSGPYQNPPHRLLRLLRLFRLRL